MLALTLFIPVSGLCGSQGTSVVGLENQKPGAVDWQLQNPATAREIEGYASATSVNRGGQLNLFVNTTNSAYVLDVYRIGWYGGAGARHLFGPIAVPGTVQPMPIKDPATRMVECNWTNPYTLKIPGNPEDPTDWASGVYLARVTGSDDGKQSYVIFAVRDDAASSALLVNMSFTTYQAYNNWGGASLYGFNSNDATPATKVSFNRPFAGRTNGPAAYWIGSGEFFFFSLGTPTWECNLVRWLEREGYDVSYCTSIDLQAIPNLLSRHKAFISMGHDEYWSYPMRRNVQNARDAGVNLAFFSANVCYWQVRFEASSIDGTPDRTMVCFKSLADPVFATSSNELTTVRFRSPPVLDNEASLMGLSFDGIGDGDLVVSNPNHWMFANTGVGAGHRLPGLLGYELDCTNAFSPAGIQVAFASPYFSDSTEDHSPKPYAHAASYVAPSGATVFASGTMQWNWGLDDFGQSQSWQNPVAQQVTRNILARLKGGPPPYPVWLFCTDSATRGRWKPHYGADGYVLPLDTTNLPPYASLEVTNATAVPYVDSSRQTDALQRASGADRYLAGWCSPTNFTLDLRFNDTTNHQVALYFWDWNSAGRTQQIDIIDLATTNLLDRRTIGGFTNGEWWVWEVNGPVRFQFQNLAGPDCLLNAIAFGNGGNAAFVGEDPVSQGNWAQSYGSDGQYMAGGRVHYPAYLEYSGYSGLVTNFSLSTTEPRGLAAPGSTNRVLAAWLGAATYNLTVTDDNWHQLALYFVDIDRLGHRQNVSLYDSLNNNLLDSREVTDFVNGKYLVWNIRGGVKVRLQPRTAAPPCLSGVFFGRPNRPPFVAITNPLDLQPFQLPTNIVLTAFASDMDGLVEEVSFFSNDRLLGRVTNSPFQFLWTNAVVGTSQVLAVARDNRMAFGTSAPVSISLALPLNYQAPSVGIQWPTNGCVLQSPTNLLVPVSIEPAATSIAGLTLLLDGNIVGSLLTNALFINAATNLTAGAHTVSACVTDQFGVVVFSPKVPFTVLPAVAEASFRDISYAAQGSWRKLYGSDGEVIINNATNLPSYATLAPSGSRSYIWMSSTDDPRALEKPGGTGRFAGAWYTYTNFLVDVDLRDGNKHRITMYCVDWGRLDGTQTIEILDALNDKLLDTRIFSGFQNGVYLSWEVVGHIRFRFSRIPPNTPAVLTGIFLDPPRAAPEISLLSPRQGDSFAPDTTFVVSAAVVMGQTNISRLEILTNGAPVGATLSKPDYKTSLTLPAGSYWLAARATDASGVVAVSDPVWMTVETTRAAAYFAGATTNQQSNWNGSFGQEGYVIAADGISLPPYAVAGLNAQVITWDADTLDWRGLQRAEGTSRVAAAWYAFTNVTFEVQSTNTQFRRVTLYCVDWTRFPGVQSIDVLDPTSGLQLDHQVLSNFFGGVWLAWDTKGHVVFRISRAAGSPALVSGIFLDPSPVLSEVSLSSPVSGSVYLAGTNLILTAESDKHPPIGASVQFYDGAWLLGTANGGPPYTFTWTNAPAGNHNVTARVVGPALQLESAPVEFTILKDGSAGILRGQGFLTNGTYALEIIPAKPGIVCIEAATNLNPGAFWEPLATNTCGGPFQFIIPDITNYPSRFFRASFLPSSLTLQILHP